MKLTYTIITFSIISICPVALSSSKPISGEPIMNGAQDIEYVQYYLNGAAIPQEGTEYIALVDTIENSILVTTRNESLRDSIKYYFIPGDRFTVILNASLDWDDNSQSLIYSYTINSDIASLVSIWSFRIDWTNDCKQIINPYGWFGSYLRTANVYDWSKLYESEVIKPGGILNGFALKSKCPPLLGQFELWGEEKEMSNLGWNEFTWEVPSGVAGDYGSIESKTVVPGLCPESIEPSGWVDRIVISLGDLTAYGYMKNEEFHELRALLLNLRDLLRRPEEQTLEKLEEHVNSTLNELTKFESLIEPEAMGYIVENLKHMLRNMDIIHFEP